MKFVLLYLWTFKELKFSAFKQWLILLMQMKKKKYVQSTEWPESLKPYNFWLIQCSPKKHKDHQTYNLYLEEKKKEKTETKLFSLRVLFPSSI